MATMKTISSIALMLPLFRALVIQFSLLASHGYSSTMNFV